jgi:phage tail protein X
VLSFVWAVDGTDGPILPALFVLLMMLVLSLRVIFGLIVTSLIWTVTGMLACVTEAVWDAKFTLTVELAPVAVMAPVDGICVMLDVYALELAAVWPDPAVAAARSHCSLFSIRGGPTYWRAA